MPRYAQATDFGDKRRMRRIIASPLTFIILLILIGIVGWNTWDIYTKWRTSEAVLEKARVAYDDLQEREDFLQEKIEFLSTDIGIESEVRERFGVAKAGEKVIVILDEKETGELEEERHGLWSIIKGWFGRE